jgi:hypothetical protein
VRRVKVPSSKTARPTALTLAGARATLSGMRLSTAALAVLISLAAAAASMAASTGRAPTDSYLGTRKTQNLTRITPAGPRSWTLDCVDYAGGYVDAGPRHRVIHVHYVDEQIGGVARLQSDGRWPSTRASTTSTAHPTRLSLPRSWLASLCAEPRRVGTSCLGGERSGSPLAPMGLRGPPPCLRSAETNALLETEKGRKGVPWLG